MIHLSQLLINNHMVHGSWFTRTGLLVNMDYSYHMVYSLNTQYSGAFPFVGSGKMCSTCSANRYPLAQLTIVGNLPGLSAGFSFLNLDFLSQGLLSFLAP
jgi:hypothetical protein